MLATRKQDGQGEVIFVLIVAAIIALALWGAYAWDRAACDRMYNHIGETRWGLIEGCMVEVEPDLWIPADSYYYKQDEN